ncbi:hypothetical protein BH23ACT3_BH23ACT3_05750 [soil metagenome]
MREWVIYALIMAVVFTLFFNDSGLVGALAGLLVSGPLYLALGAVLAKLGYQRKSIKEMRRDRTNPPESTPDEHATTPRHRPAPTRRTSIGQSNRPRSKRRR